MPDFNGFSKELLKYFQNLKKNNSKQWFEKHRNDYDEFVLSPLVFYSDALITPAYAHYKNMLPLHRWLMNVMDNK